MRKASSPAMPSGCPDGQVAGVGVAAGVVVDDVVVVGLVVDVAEVLDVVDVVDVVVDVVELDVETDPEELVDVALFDVYGQPGLGIARVKSLVACANVGAVAVYTWSLNEASRRAAVQAGARGLIAKSLSAATTADALMFT